MISTTTTKCPEWCEEKHTIDSTHPDDRPIHSKFFEDHPGGAKVEVWVMYHPDGLIEDSGFLWSLETCDDPEDMEAVAKWCLEAAKFMREVRGVKA